MTDDVVVVGGGVAGLSAALFTARAGLPTTVVSTGESILERNAHLENYPGFPAGVDPRRLLDLVTEQASDAGADRVDGHVTRVTATDCGFELHTVDGDRYTADYVVAASWADPSYLDGLDVDLVDRGSQTFVGVDEFGATSVEGLYAAGRLAEQHHQAVVAAGTVPRSVSPSSRTATSTSTTTGPSPRATSRGGTARSRRAVRR